jgi:hypothetical protein
MHKPAHHVFAQQKSVAECLWLWPTVIHRASYRQDADFAARIDQQSQRPDWEPSPMQLNLMRRMVEHYVPDGIRLDPEMIELAGAARGRAG